MCDDETACDVPQDDRAFDLFVLQWIASMKPAWKRRLGRLMRRSSVSPDDALQVGCAKIEEKRERLRPKKRPGEWRAWGWTVVRNAAIDLMRKEAKHARRLGAHGADDEGPRFIEAVADRRQLGPAADAAQRELLNRLEACVLALPRRSRTMWLLRHWMHLKPEQIAELEHTQARKHSAWRGLLERVYRMAPLDVQRLIGPPMNPGITGGAVSNVVDRAMDDLRRCLGLPDTKPERDQGADSEEPS